MLRGLHGRCPVEGGGDHDAAEVGIDSVERGFQVGEALTLVESQEVTGARERTLAHVDETHNLHALGELRQNAADPGLGHSACTNHQTTFAQLHAFTTNYGGSCNTPRRSV